MYHNKSFFIGEAQPKGLFLPVVSSAFQIMVDGSYFHLCDNEERQHHQAGTIALVRCTLGSGKIYTLDGDIELQEGDYAFLRFHHIVKYKATAEIWSYRWVNFSAADGLPFPLMTVHSAPVTEAQDAAFAALLAAGADNTDPTAIHYLFLSYFYQVTGALTTNEERTAPSRQIDDICSFIQQKLFTRVTVDTVSAFFGISSRRLHQIFAKELGISPKQYILKKKLEEGYRLLVQTAMPVHTVADRLCFSSPYHFTNAFKRLFGQTPTQVRALQAKAENE